MGPVVVLNAHEKGCDALVLLPGSDQIIHAPLQLIGERARALGDMLDGVISRHSSAKRAGPADRGFLIVARKDIDVDEMIASLLAELWRDLVKPTLDMLGLPVSVFQTS